MSLRPRTKRKISRKQIRCPKCGAHLSTQTRRCRRCHKPTGKLP